MAGLLEELRRDPTSHCHGVPRDITQLTGLYCRPLEGRPQKIKERNNCNLVGLTLEDQLIVQTRHPETNQVETQVLAVPDLTFIRTMDIPPCQIVWPLANGHFFSKIDQHCFGFQQEEYCLECTNGGISLVRVTDLELFNRMLVPWSSHLDVTPEGKFYISHDGTVYEYDLFQPGPARRLFDFTHDDSVRHPTKVSLRQNNIKVILNQVYCCLVDTLLIYDLTTGVLTNHPRFRTIDSYYPNYILVDPVMNYLYFYFLGKVKRADGLQISQDLFCLDLRYITRSGYLISNYKYDSFRVIISN